MNNGFNGADIVMTFNGKVIGEMQSLQLMPEHAQTQKEENREIKNWDKLSLFNREFSFTMENVTVSDEFLGKLLPTSNRFDVVATSINYPRGNKLPKKKRIRNKWIKKYQQTFELNNCVIE